MKRTILGIDDKFMPTVRTVETMTLKDAILI